MQTVHTALLLCSRAPGSQVPEDGGVQRTWPQTSPEDVALNVADGAPAAGPPIGQTLIEVEEGTHLVGGEGDGWRRGQAPPRRGEGQVGVGKGMGMVRAAGYWHRRLPRASQNCPPKRNGFGRSVHKPAKLTQIL